MAGQAGTAEGIPGVLRASLARDLAPVQALLDEHGLPAPPELERVLACSAFVARVLARDPEALVALCGGDPTGGDDGPAARLARVAEQAEDEPALQRGLRLERNRALARIAWRDIAGRASLEQVMADLSAFADAALEAALAWLQRDQERRFGVPRDAAGAAQRLVVLALGKLGAHELNFSSDVDLILAFPAGGETDAERRSISNQEFFDRLAQRLAKTLSAVTPEGFVCRVDTRLRPFGDSGPPTMSFDAMHGYYEAHARDWERYALIKARPAAGDVAAGARLLERLQPFVYRRYLDFGALESLREMKDLIAEEVTRRELAGNIKLGPGGIREIEFIGQTFQLIRGGREPDLRRRAILEVLVRLGELGHLPAGTADELAGAYRFLRTVENRLQQVDDRQTHALPGDEAGRARLALGLDLADWAAAREALQRHRGRVGAHFADLLAGGEADRRQSTRDLGGIWAGTRDREAMAGALAAAGYPRAEEVAGLLATLDHEPKLRRLGTAGRARLDKLVPRVLDAARAAGDPVTTLARIFEIIAAIGQRSVYFTLLTEHPEALGRLVQLCAASPWIADQIGRQPILLDALLDPRVLYHPPDRPRLEQALRAGLARFPVTDVENAMEVLRQFTHTQVLRVAAADVADVLPVAEVSNRLSDIAETVLEAALDLAWAHLVLRHGQPMSGEDGDRHPAGFAVIAYGKLGGLELGYGADLDLVFVHSGRGARQHTDGERPLDNNTFFTRLAQRLIHLLQTYTPGGRAYEIDTRLRPSGTSGLLVTGLDAFREYELSSAWTWEHQALLRARAVAGDQATREGFEGVRREALSRRRDPEALRRDILDMRARMRSELSRDADGAFDLKQGFGGITDIEFMVQYAVLRWAPDYPQLLDVTDNLRQLEALAETRLLDPGACRSLHDAYFAYRAEVHRQALLEGDTVVDAEAFAEHREAVVRVWGRFMETGDEAREGDRT